MISFAAGLVFFLWAWYNSVKQSFDYGLIAFVPQLIASVCGFFAATAFNRLYTAIAIAMTLLGCATIVTVYGTVQTYEKHVYSWLVPCIAWTIGDMIMVFILTLSTYSDDENTKFFVVLWSKTSAVMNLIGSIVCMIAGWIFWIWAGVKSVGFASGPGNYDPGVVGFILPIAAGFTGIYHSLELSSRYGIVNISFLLLSIGAVAAAYLTVLVYHRDLLPDHLFMEFIVALGFWMLGLLINLAISIWHLVAANKDRDYERIEF